MGQEDRLDYWKAVLGMCAWEKKGIVGSMDAVGKYGDTEKDIGKQKHIQFHRHRGARRSDLEIIIIVCYEIASQENSLLEYSKI